MFLCPRRLKVNKREKYNHSRPLHVSTQAAAGTCTHLVSYSVGVLFSLQAQDFLNRPQVQCTTSRAACMRTCFQKCFEFQPSIIAGDSSALFLLRVCFCLLIRGWKRSWTDGLNSTVAKICRDFFWFWSQKSFFWKNWRLSNYIRYGWARTSLAGDAPRHKMNVRVPMDCNCFCEFREGDLTS